MKKNKRKYIFAILIIVFVILIIAFGIFKIITKNGENNDNKDDKEIERIEELKQESSIQGDTEIYEIQEDYDGTEVLTVKADLKYKVALSGMMQNSTPEIEGLNSVKEISGTGIWIEEGSRNKIINMFNNSKYINSKYSINDKGYLFIENENYANDVDKRIKEIINGSKQYILKISSECYIIDNLTGEVLDYNFENMDKYQTYEYFESDNKMIIFINENKGNQLLENEIIDSVIKLMINS